jgi:Domain of unknown function (DUF4440)
MADKPSEQIRSLLGRLTAAWRQGRTADIAAMLHPSVVFVRPGFEGRAEGRKACVASYQEFLSAAIVLRYEESEPTIDSWGNTAVASLRWEMAWEMGGQRSDEAGVDLYVLVCDGGEWLIAWRTLLSTTTH